MLRRWLGTGLALVPDDTRAWVLALESRFVVLTMGVVYRKCAIPVAWKVVPAQEPRARRWE